MMSPPDNSFGKRMSQTSDASTERDKEVKLKLLLVNMGIARSEDVFAGGVPDNTKLVSIHDSGIHSGARQSTLRRRWYNPLSWFSKSATSTGVKHRAPDALERHDGSAMETAHPAPSTANRVVSDTATDLQRVVAETKPQRPATLSFNSLPEEVVIGLKPAVQEDRRKLHQLEESVHSMLESIEQTKHKYLVPAKELKCEAEIDAVVACYERVNLQVAALGEQQLTKLSVAQRGRWILNCGASVDRLSQCTERILENYVE